MTKHWFEYPEAPLCTYETKEIKNNQEYGNLICPAIDLNLTINRNDRVNEITTKRAKLMKKNKFRRQEVERCEHKIILLETHIFNDGLDDLFDLLLSMYPEDYSRENEYWSQSRNRFFEEWDVGDSEIEYLGKVHLNEDTEHQIYKFKDCLEEIYPDDYNVHSEW